MISNCGVTDWEQYIVDYVKMMVQVSEYLSDANKVHIPLLFRYGFSIIWYISKFFLVLQDFPHIIASVFFSLYTPSSRSRRNVLRAD